MKTFAAVILGLAASVGFSSACVAVTLFAVGDAFPGTSNRPEPTTIWTEEPTRVDVSSQNYERLPPRLSTYAKHSEVASSGSVGWIMAQAN